MPEIVPPTIAEFNPQQRGTIAPASGKRVLAAGVAQTIFQKGLSGVEADSNLQYLRIQNTSTNNVKICLNDDATPNTYHAILAADTGVDAGNGGVIELSGAWFVTKVSVISETGSSIVILKVNNTVASRLLNS